MSENHGLNGRTALVTGAGKGIGRAIALELARCGANVAINYRSDADAARATTAAVKEFGVAAYAIQADVAEPEDRARLVASVREHLGPISLLVNNAAYSRLVPLDEITSELWRRIYAANVDAVFELTRSALEDMRQLGVGAIVNVSSTAATRLDPLMIPYGSSKAAVNAFTKAMGKALAAEGIRINAVAPGFTRTPRVDTVPLAQQEAMLAGVPMNRLAEPEEIARVVRFLLSDDASYVTGEVVPVAGGS